MIITMDEARRRVLAAYRYHRAARVSPCMAMHNVRDYYAVSVADAAVAGHLPPPHLISCYAAAEAYLHSIPDRTLYWSTGHIKGRTWRETELRARSARKRLALCQD